MGTNLSRYTRKQGGGKAVIRVSCLALSIPSDSIQSTEPHNSLDFLHPPVNQHPSSSIEGERWQSWPWGATMTRAPPPRCEKARWRSLRCLSILRRVCVPVKQIRSGSNRTKSVVRLDGQREATEPIDIPRYPRCAQCVKLRWNAQCWTVWIEFNCSTLFWFCNKIHFVYSSHLGA